MKTFTNPEQSLTIVAADVDSFLDQIKANGLKAGKKPVAELFDGKRDEVAGFYLVDTAETNLVADELVDETPKAADADETPAFSDAAVAGAVEAALADGVEVQTERVLTPEPAAKPATVRVKAVVKASTPKGKIKPVRKGTKIALGLEMLAGGTTEAALLGVCGDDPVDFVNRRVTKRGYGVALTDGSLSLVFPEGVTAIAYSGA